jgi:16S rRNA G1207 methylase RsmC
VRPRPEQEHYFTADPAAPFTRTPVRLQAWGLDVELLSGSGVFAHGRLDLGTGVLLRSVEPPAAGRVLDLGCGYGAIGLAVALASPQVSVVGVDVNERALLLARENAARLRVADRFSACLPGDVPGGDVEEIWSNPPIRIGKPALHAMLLTWLPRLAPGGRAVMVVGRNLGADSLQRWLADRGWPTTRLASAKGFRVLESRRAG